MMEAGLEKFQFRFNFCTEPLSLQIPADVV